MEETVRPLLGECQKAFFETTKGFDSIREGIDQCSLAGLTPIDALRGLSERVEYVRERNAQQLKLLQDRIFEMVLELQNGGAPQR